MYMISQLHQISYSTTYNSIIYDPVYLDHWPLRHKYHFISIFYNW